ncbi:MAG: hypothetical protein GX638_11670, partial [Crenarchaeota archaeon]|nr:hypothetical protein [Thermoproteota archaeon]
MEILKPTFQRKPLNINRREFTTSVMFGVAAGVIAAIAERADALATGGNATPLGYINTYMWILIAAALFGPIGAIITTEIQAILSLITFANPLSWLWPFINFIFALAAGLTFIGITKLKPKLGIKTKLTLMSLVCAFLDIPLVYVVLVTVLGLPFAAYLTVLPMYLILQLIPSTILAFIIVKAILRSKILG